MQHTAATRHLAPSLMLFCPLPCHSATTNNGGCRYSAPLRDLWALQLNHILSVLVAIDMKIYFCTTKQFMFHAKERHNSVLFGRPTIHTPQDVCADHKARPRLPACDQLSIPGDACSVHGTPHTVVVSHHGPLTPRLLGPDREPRGGAHAHRHVLVATAHAAQVRDAFFAQTIGLLPHALSKNCAMIPILTSVAHPMAPHAGREHEHGRAAASRAQRCVHVAALGCMAWASDGKRRSLLEPGGIFCCPDAPGAATCSSR
jgi:hypothetical protein